MQKHNIADDPDKELDLIEQEKHQAMAAADVVAHNRGLAKYYKDQGDEEMALYHETLAEIAIRVNVQKIVSGMTTEGPVGDNGNGANLPIGTNPEAEAGKMAMAPMTDMANSMKQY